MDSSHSVHLPCLWAAQGHLSLYFLRLLCPASQSFQAQGADVMLAPSEIFIPQKLSKSVESPEEKPSCSCEINPGALGDLVGGPRPCVCGSIHL